MHACNCPFHSFWTLSEYVCDIIASLQVPSSCQTVRSSHQGFARSSAALSRVSRVSTQTLKSLHSAFAPLANVFKQAIICQVDLQFWASSLQYRVPVCLESKAVRHKGHIQVAVIISCIHVPKHDCVSYHTCPHALPSKSFHSRPPNSTWFQT